MNKNKRRVGISREVGLGSPLRITQLTMSQEHPNLRVPMSQYCTMPFSAFQNLLHPSQSKIASSMKPPKVFLAPLLLS
jgi:hypothetical protein